MSAIDCEKIVEIATKVAEKNGYVVWSDFDEHLRVLVKKKKLKVSEAHYIHAPIRKCLVDKGWREEKGRGRRPTKFYPLGS